MKEYNHPNESVCTLADVLVGHQLPPRSPRLQCPRL